MNGGKTYKGGLFRRFLYFLVALLALPLLTINCSSEGPTLTPEPTVSQSEVIHEAADIYLSSGRAANILAEELFARLTDDNLENDPFILSVRSLDDYAKGHIPGAINIPWREVFKEENLAKLPEDGQIVVYCYTGHTSSQITALLGILGYDAVNLKFGMTSWTLDQDIAPGRYEEAKHCKNYPIVRGTEPEGAEEIPCPVYP